MFDCEYIRDFWGKAQPIESRGPAMHPLAYHMLDVGAVAHALLSTRPLTLLRAAEFLNLGGTETVALLTFAAVLHDLGKFARAFQKKVPELWIENGIKLPAIDPHRHHGMDGWLIWHGENYTNNGIGRDVISRLWPEAPDVFDALIGASVAHHGRPFDTGNATTNIGNAFGPGAAAARVCALDMVALLLPRPIVAASPKSISAQTFWLSGFVTLADWVGSNQRWFPYHKPDRSLLEYWAYAQVKAVAAIAEAGLNETPPALSKTFYDLTGFSTLTPMQCWAQDMPLPDEPSLFIIEDVTGAGKTEAAQMLVHRLMAAGRASGTYWAMPTQATANAMFERQQKLITALFAHGAEPRLVLAHGQAGLSDRFQASIIEMDRQQERYGNGDDEDRAATSACTAFLADDKRAAMVADVGAGTIDQALLGALPVKFNTVRLFGLANKVLIFDEAHAYDPYMQAEIEALLQFQAILGGCAIILSATLPHDMRQKYVTAWQRGLKAKRQPLRERKAYPLTTVVGGADLVETPVAAAETSKRTMPVRLVHDVGDALAAVAAAAKKGSACVWIRNTVNEALKAAEELRSRDIEPLLFHARFAQCDRQAREAEVMEIFGKKSTAADRCGKVLVATQVVEQSLDLDFDCMVSDLAPVDLLIQRAGRLWRHPSRARPTGLPMELIVLSPLPVDEPKDDWIKAFSPGTAAVYRNAGVLWCTARILAQTRAIAAPEGLRDLVEYVYDESDPPDALVRATLKAEGEANAERSEAQWNVLKPTDGYCVVDQKWTDERKVSTRLIDNQVTVRLGRLGSGKVVPYATGSDEWKAWALSEVRVSGRRVPADAAPPPRLAAAVAEARSRWGRFEQDLPLIVLEEEEEGGYWGRYISEKGEKSILYDSKTGLLF